MSQVHLLSILVASLALNSHNLVEGILKKSDPPTKVLVPGEDGANDVVQIVLPSEEDEDEDDKCPSVKCLARRLELQEPLTDEQEEILQDIVDKERNGDSFTEGDMEGMLYVAQVCSVVEMPSSFIEELFKFADLTQLLLLEKDAAKPPKCYYVLVPN